MGYESNFEVPDIEDNLLRGVADLTDLLVCPDSEPEGGERGTSSRLLRLKEIASPGKRNVHARARSQTRPPKRAFKSVGIASFFASVRDPMRRDGPRGRRKPRRREREKKEPDSKGLSSPGGECFLPTNK